MDEDAMAEYFADMLRAAKCSPRGREADGAVRPSEPYRVVASHGGRVYFKVHPFETGVLFDDGDTDSESDTDTDSDSDNVPAADMAAKFLAGTAPLDGDLLLRGWPRNPGTGGDWLRVPENTALLAAAADAALARICWEDPPAARAGNVRVVDPGALDATRRAEQRFQDLGDGDYNLLGFELRTR